jgi:divalent metal cation (Fe/Co/Zn/Cd) transporter
MWGSILLSLDVQFREACSAAQITSAVDRLEKEVRTEHPNIERIFIEAELLNRVGTKPGEITP